MLMFWWCWCFDDNDVFMMMMMYWSKDQSMMMMMYWSEYDDVLIKRSEYDDDNVLIKWSICDDNDVLIKRLEYHDDDAVRELKYDDGADHDVTNQNMMMLLIERTKYWRCCCWSKGQSADVDVVDRKVKVLMMMLSIKQSKCCCCWRLKMKTKDDVVGQSVVAVEDEDEDYMMLKSFQWFIDVLPWWCWWCPLSISYYCCCWCCCRIPFSLKGKCWNIVTSKNILYVSFVVPDGPTGSTNCIYLYSDVSNRKN